MLFATIGGKVYYRGSVPILEPISTVHAGALSYQPRWEQQPGELGTRMLRQRGKEGCVNAGTLSGI